MSKVLFVCYGNIMRSQIAEAYFNSMSEKDAAISAGIDPTTPMRYSKPAEEVIAVMQEEGIDISRKTVKTVTKGMVDAADNVYVLTDKSTCPEFITSSPKVTYWEIEDPFGTSIENFRRIRDQIKSKVVEIV